MAQSHVFMRYFHSLYLIKITYNSKVYSDKVDKINRGYVKYP